jgi:hypothetical protein
MSLINLENYNQVKRWLNLGKYPNFNIWRFIDDLLVEFPELISSSKRSTSQVIRDAEPYIIKKELEECIKS